MSEYRLTSLWRIAAPLEAVWDAIYDSAAWPVWWKGVECVVDIEKGDASGLGARQRLTWKSVLPYRLTFETRVTRVEPLRLLEGRVEGELEGVGRWHFSHEDGVTVVRYDWQVRTTRPWMNWLAPLARPLFEWNHDAVMREGGQGLARLLDAHDPPE
ncbi:SRPBCC family protein [Crenobacter cavernae]|uniref:Polyketide cyclase n=1 Tax=Crenobacter cavernae TaxID=2290923 RepID=A0A345Y8L3_9NEIS|nr:SRPBCC family protein [Crenobacter cavernae]AXK40265.1 polyketide cyclase [Crenobacter cavernae]